MQASFLTHDLSSSVHPAVPTVPYFTRSLELLENLLCLLQLFFSRKVRDLLCEDLAGAVPWHDPTKGAKGSLGRRHLEQPSKRCFLNPFSITQIYGLAQKD